MNKQAIDEVARWIYDDHGIPLWLSREIVDKVAEILTAHEGVKRLAYPTGTDVTLVPMSLQKQIAKRMIEEFEKEVISVEYTFSPYQLALLAWIKRWLEKQGE